MLFGHLARNRPAGHGLGGIIDVYPRNIDVDAGGIEVDVRDIDVDPGGIQVDIGTIDVYIGVPDVYPDTIDVYLRDIDVWGAGTQATGPRLLVDTSPPGPTLDL